ncbi:MAG TPA: glycosyltransferase family 39 protein [Acidimicrobiales bacterium]|nr:glycosyltransferase family 39 protein [Acidimicrobiales bacterium]
MDGAAPGDRPDALAPVLVTGLCGLVGFVLPGLALAVAGWWSGPAALLAGLAATAVLVCLWAPWSDGRARAPGSRVPAAAVALVVAGSVVVAASFAAHHVLTERDPGVYATTGRSLARTGDLVVDARPGPFAADDVAVRSQGWSDEAAGGELRPQFFHGWPVLLALGSALGGDQLLFAVPAVAAGLALLAFALLARRWLHPWVAVVATVALALTLPWAVLARDAYSEFATAAAVLGGWWALADAGRDGRPRRYLVAGLVLGTALCLRVDAALFLAPVPVFLALERRAGRPVRAVVTVAAGLLVGAALTALDAGLVAPAYLRNIKSEVAASGGALALSCVVGVVLLTPVGGAVVDRLRPHRRVLAAVAAGGVLVAAAFAGLVRPWLVTERDFRQPFIEALQVEQGLPVDGTRRWSEDSLVWLTWYLGVPVVVAGVVGLAWRLRDLVLGRHRERLPLVLGVLFASAVYLWRPSATPDHLWVTRRFVVATLPGLVLLGAEVAQHLLARRWPVALRAAGAGLLVAMVAVPALALGPVAGVEGQRPYLAAVHDTCDAVGEDGAVLLREGGGLELVLPPALRAWCGVPVATAGPAVGAERVDELAAAWADDGRQLFVIGPEDELPADPVLVVDALDHPLEQRIDGRPDGTVERRLRYAVAPAGPGA